MGREGQSISVQPEPGMVVTGVSEGDVSCFCSVKLCCHYGGGVEGEGGGGVPAPLCLSLTSVPQGKRRPSRPLIFLEAAFPSNLKKVNTRCNRSENSAKRQFVMIPALDDVTMGEVRVVKVPGLGFLDEKAADRLQELFEV